jgi:hypothetical protein
MVAHAGKAVDALASKGAYDLFVVLCHDVDTEAPGLA